MADKTPEAPEVDGQTLIDHYKKAHDAFTEEIHIACFGGGGEAQFGRIMALHGLFCQALESVCRRQDRDPAFQSLMEKNQQVWRETSAQELRHGTPLRRFTN